MTFSQMLYQFIIGPIQTMLDLIFGWVYRHTFHAGLSIVILSLAVNVLVLPLYRRADQVQEKEREKQKRMAPFLKHIRQTFRGDEKLMMLEAYYRTENYKPYHTLKGSLSLFLEVPFFIAAYHFLSELTLLKGMPFGPIADLGAPDALIKIAGLSVNLLPLLMTGLNLLAAAVYLKGSPLKAKIQLAVMAAIFLVLLYDSPAGLVFYWTLNNLFSLGKNLFFASKNQKKLLRAGAVALGVLMTAAALLLAQKSLRVRVPALGAGLALALLPFIQRKKRVLPRMTDKQADAVFALSSLLLFLLLGALLPLRLIAASPLEFVGLVDKVSPWWFFVSCALTAGGLFLLWLRIFYRLCEEKSRPRFSAWTAAAALGALVNAFFFSTGYGNLEPMLVYSFYPDVGSRAILLNAAAMLAVGAAALALAHWRPQAMKGLLFALAAALAVQSGLSAYTIQTTLHAHRLAQSAGQSGKPRITLSKTGKNVIVLMMDRATGVYFPYLMSGHPLLKEQLAGFTYYPNTLSFGTQTLTGSPGLYGGYGYTPQVTEKRTDVSLKQKQNEALRLMPGLFSKAGWDVTVVNPTFANWQWIADVSVFDDMPRVKAYTTQSKFVTHDADAVLARRQAMFRNFFLYSLFRASPTVLHLSLYTGGTYNASNREAGMVQEVENGCRAWGLDHNFMENYAVLHSLPDITEYKENNGAFLMLSNDLPHSPALLQRPDYEPRAQVDNTAFDENAPRAHFFGGPSLSIRDADAQKHFHATMATLLQLGRWFDSMRAQGVWNNTRIIIVADHGYVAPDFGCRKDEKLDLTHLNPLLMYKDFGASALTEDPAFMTNADTPLLTMRDIIPNPVHPDTGEPVNDALKQTSVYPAVTTEYWNIADHSGNSFRGLTWYILNGHSLFDPGSWTRQP